MSSHISHDLPQARMKGANDLFAWNYPETTDRLIVVNAPRLFAAFWAVVRLFLHPITAAKISVFGSSYAKPLSQLGLQQQLTSEGKLAPHAPVRWVDTLASLRAQDDAADAHVAGGPPAAAAAAPSAADSPLTRGFVPEADRQHLRRLCEEAPTISHDLPRSPMSSHDLRRLCDAAPSATSSRTCSAAASASRGPSPLGGAAPSAIASATLEAVPSATVRPSMAVAAALKSAASAEAEPPNYRAFSL